LSIRQDLIFVALATTGYDRARRARVDLSTDYL